MTDVATLVVPATFESDDSIRLRLKPDGDGSGYVDGAWWPHSRDLTQDLPTLLDAAGPRLGAVKRVIYRIQEWDAAPKQLRYGDRMVSLDGYRTQRADTIYISDLDRRQLVLLVVPPMTDPHLAHDVMTNAAVPGSTAAPAVLLAGTRRAG
ncbi:MULTISPECIES: DUF5994 family protein [unclassified Mycobacterium]|uniref:DUF5994 family protein n=1 Tax=unclassified Mycobacterium TaxID=2642494 RepID=UPI0009929864|nr:MULTISPECIES: DUF5994 family protein [unclassified Mycobacterium]